MSKAKPQITSTTTYEFPIRGPPEKKSLKQIIYDNETGHILGRTAKSWAQLFLFYIIFYTVLASLFTICLQGLFLSLDDQQPTWLLEESIIGTNPGVALRPVNDDMNSEASIIKYSAKNQTEVNVWTNRIDEFLEPYLNKSLLNGGGTNQIHCDWEHGPKDDEVCFVDVKSFGDCSPEKGYGYNQSSPCLFLKLNKIFNWVPQYYNDVSELPESMPESLKKYINDTKEKDQVWVSCDGLTKPDKEVLLNRIEYPAGQGIPGYFYPFHSQKGYLNYIVPVKVNHPELGKTFTIECKMWAKNIVVRGGRERSGSTLAEITIQE